MIRPLIDDEHIDRAFQDLASAMKVAIGKNGSGSYASSHEILGVLDEELDELRGEIHANRPEGIQNELLDIAVAAVFGYACRQSCTCDW